jgi:hypothetical protein
VPPAPQVLLGLASASGSGSSAATLRGSVPRETVIGLFRDLRGIATATNSRRTYGMLFDWLYPAHFPTILACLEAWAGALLCSALLPAFACGLCPWCHSMLHDRSTPTLPFPSCARVMRACCGRYVLSRHAGDFSLLALHVQLATLSHARHPSSLLNLTRRQSHLIHPSLPPTKRARAHRFPSQTRPRSPPRCSSSWPSLC